MHYKKSTIGYGLSLLLFKNFFCCCCCCCCLFGLGGGVEKTDHPLASILFFHIYIPPTEIFFIVSYRTFRIPLPSLRKRYGNEGIFVCICPSSIVSSIPLSKCGATPRNIPGVTAMELSQGLGR